LIRIADSGREQIQPKLEAYEGDQLPGCGAAEWTWRNVRPPTFYEVGRVRLRGSTAMAGQHVPLQRENSPHLLGAAGKLLTGGTGGDLWSCEGA